jgi:hypothetical protein
VKQSADKISVSFNDLPLTISGITIRRLWQAEGSVRVAVVDAPPGASGEQMLRCLDLQAHKKTAQRPGE